MQSLGVAGLLRLAVETLQSPKRTLRMVLDFVITMPELLQITAFVVALSTLLTALTPVPPDMTIPLVQWFYANVLILFALQYVVFLGLAGLMTIIGQMFQGHGTFKESLTALVWLQFIVFGISLIQLFFAVTIPQVNVIIFLFSIMAMVHLTVAFIMEVHGFNNAVLVFAGVVGTFIGVVFSLVFIFVLLGITPEVAPHV
ncbi:MAG: hypothetical protein QM492_10710 [Rhodobacterales bacterium]